MCHINDTYELASSWKNVAFTFVNAVTHTGHTALARRYRREFLQAAAEKENNVAAVKPPLSSDELCDTA